ncbi:tyrosyl-DNA phosphodiesterase 1 [Apostasia shenzhenica]|uniref:Tyrosyl-DNA phosphodiesterase 1 n=1 Tax=Apostasia shenzhenica TaxID=1088818 RepID=A0A2I0BC80_9ASPA|nr:tyrosyl-DNA phosphodiesterase 1 [Apostasia shenzhenica]
MGFCYLRPLGSGAGERQQLTCLISDRLYTVGRKRRHCQIKFNHCCVSRRHCQIFLDGDDRKLRLVDGFLFSRASRLEEVRRTFRSESECLGFKVSQNGVYLNGQRLRRGIVADLSEGDEVAFGCGGLGSAPCCKMRCGFVVRSIVRSEKETNLDLYSDGKTFFLNRLEYTGHLTSYHHREVTLKELLHPVESLKQVFIATFTCDVSWFLQCCQIPKHLPVTIACHCTEKCWNSDCHVRSRVPCSNYPNLLLIYPPFPDEIAFGKEHKKKGVACHHPKLFVLQREESVRIIITSANLTAKQWNQITNTVWWQDFPCRDGPDYTSFFGRSDFAAHLAGFIASLVVGVPRQAHWIKELAKYDFARATAHLIASIPGVHSPNNNFSGIDCFVSPATAKCLGFVQASVVGLSHRFNDITKSSGTELRKLASCLGMFQDSSLGLVEVILKRNHNIPADANAISVIVANVDKQADVDCVQLGFLPRDVAKWVSPLLDNSFLELSAFIHPKEALAAALDGKHAKVQCLLCVIEGPNFSKTSRLILPEHLSALCSFIASIQRCLGLWRLQEVCTRSGHSAFGWIYCGSHNFSPAAWGRIVSPF